MDATAEQIDLLEKLQEVDRMRLRAERDLRQLPYRAQVMELRKRRKDVEQKLETVGSMLAREERQVTRIETEDRQLQEKQAKTQEKIDGAKGDYRAVNTWTRDLEGMAKRRATLDADLTRAMERMGEIEGVRNQAQEAIAKLDAQERKLVELHRSEGERLTAEAEKCRAAGRAIAARLPRELLERYVAAVQRCGGVGLARLQGSQCSACRGGIEPNRMLQVRRDAPLSECPNCHRLLVVDE